MVIVNQDIHTDVDFCEDRQGVNDNVQDLVLWLNSLGVHPSWLSCDF